MTARGRRDPGPAEVARVAALLVVVAMAPVVGDVGGCGQDPEELDAFKFFNVKAQIDCARCADCQILSEACVAACDFAHPTEFPIGCYPLVHDGEVCLNALEVASCAEYRDYMSDEAPSTPTECNFCPTEEAP